jgi:Uma2 family endonuclease
MTVDEFLAWDPADPSAPLWQLIDGEPVVMAPGSENHGALQGEIGRLIVTPGIVPRIHANRNFRIPDLGVTCASPSGAQFVPEPVLLVEILSPSNESETWAMSGPTRRSPA